MTKVYSRISPHFGKLQIWDNQSLLRNTPPHFRKLQIWDDQSLLQNTPPPILENFRFGDDQSLLWNTPPPISENFRFGMTKVYSRIPPPISENFRFGMTKVYSGIPPPPPAMKIVRVQVQEFQNTESYYMWRLYPARITTSLIFCNQTIFKMEYRSVFERTIGMI